MEGSGKLPAAGDKLAGKYSIVRVIGEGGMGVVYEGRHERLGQRVAIKVLREAERKNREVVARFEREARLAAKLKSTNVARVTDVDALDDGTPFLVMEYLEGVDLDFELTQRGRLPIAEAVGYVLQACSAVAEAHALGIVHRDLKPHNLFLTDDGDRRVIKLLDFGISKVTEGEPDSVTLTRSSLGTPLYMSPEQIRSARNADHRSDLWSLGVILYELTTGRPPFDGDGPAAVIASITADAPQAPIELRPEMGRALSEAIMRALEKDPERRFASVVDFAEALKSFGASGSWAPPPLHTSSQPRITIPDLPRISADAITVLDPYAGRDSMPDLGESHAPVASSAHPATSTSPAVKRLGTLPWVAGAALLSGAVAALAWQLSSAPTAVSAASPTPAATSTIAPPVRETAPAEPPPAPVVAPMPVPSRADASAAPPTGKPKHAAAAGKPAAPTPSTASAPKPSSAPPPAPANTVNPLHL